MVHDLLTKGTMHDRLTYLSWVSTAVVVSPNKVLRLSPLFGTAAESTMAPSSAIVNPTASARRTDLYLP